MNFWFRPLKVRERQSYLNIAVQFSYISVIVIHCIRIYCKMYQSKRCISTIKGGKKPPNIPFKVARTYFLSFLSSRDRQSRFLFIQTQWKLHETIINGEKKVAKLYLIHFCFYILNKTGSFRFSIKYGFLTFCCRSLKFFCNKKLNLSIWA